MDIKENMRLGNNTAHTNSEHGEVQLGLNRKVPSETEGMFFENQIVPVWASTKDAAAILGISANALRIRKYRGEIDCRYFGKYLRFDVSHIQSLFRKQRTSRKEF